MNRQMQSELGEALAATIAEMREAADALVATLGEEHLALEHADAAALDRAGEAKLAQMRRLDQLDAERVQLSNAAPDAAERLRPTWSGVLRALETCRQLNQRNGALVNQRLAQVRTALATLTGEREEPVYDPAGLLRSPNRSQQLARA
jgi:flagella synthesis protein FlgN